MKVNGRESVDWYEISINVECGMRTIYPHRLNKVYGSKFLKDYQVITEDQRV